VVHGGTINEREKKHFSSLTGQKKNKDYQLGKASSPRGITSEVLSRTSIVGA